MAAAQSVIPTPEGHKPGGLVTARRANPLALWATAAVALARQLAATARARAATARADESGNVITDNLAWIVFGVLAIVAIGAAISGLGSDVLTWVKGQLGVG